MVAAASAAALATKVVAAATQNAASQSSSSKPLEVVSKGTITGNSHIGIVSTLTTYYDDGSETTTTTVIKGGTTTTTTTTVGGEGKETSAILDVWAGVQLEPVLIGAKGGPSKKESIGSCSISFNGGKSISIMTVKGEIRIGDLLDILGDRSTFMGSRTDSWMSLEQFVDYLNETVPGENGYGTFDKGFYYKLHNSYGGGFQITLEPFTQEVIVKLAQKVRSGMLDNSDAAIVTRLRTSYPNSPGNWSLYKDFAFLVEPSLIERDFTIGDQLFALQVIQHGGRLGDGFDVWDSLYLSTLYQAVNQDANYAIYRDLMSSVSAAQTGAEMSRTIKEFSGVFAQFKSWYTATNTLAIHKWPHPPGWTEEWRIMWGTRSGATSPHWFDPAGGEWRYHDVDNYHDTAHWDYNPWHKYNEGWQNIYPPYNK
jgi:hypothetical protein